ncbi:hypothetical protein [Pseudomonas brassicacearum]|uniref:Uncharacterized protein n=1 Tax=Pseudomonas brassicacearum TaxID=930166 RepID=A0AAJ3KU16_9PSED|nr:hypothetical protein [Pseudomonas brassicacearum]NUT79849.1 hypothetical protein [Pseudomonas brassicacearum]
MAITSENVYVRICQQNPALNPPDLYCEWAFVPNMTTTESAATFGAIQMEQLILVLLMYWALHFMFGQIKTMIESM